MEKLVKSRGCLRAVVTRGLNNVTSILKEDRRDINEIRGHMEQLNKRFTELTELDNRVYEALLEDSGVSQEELELEIENADKYAFRYHSLNFELSNLEKGTGIISPDLNYANLGKRSYKLPLLEFKKFTGDLREWLPFWAQFAKIDQDENLDDAVKFQYLLQSTVPSSRARVLVDSFPATGENYKKAVNCLKARFGRDDLLVEVYVRELLNLMVSNITNKRCLPLDKLYDKLECQLRSLETLNVTTDKCAAMLLPLVESCLPSDVLRVWQRNRSLMESTHCLREDSTSNEGLKNRLELLMKFIRAEVEGEQKVTLAASGFGISPECSKDRRGLQGNTFAKESQEKKLPTAACLFTESTLMCCVFCGKGGHPSDKCFKAQELTLPERRQILREKRCCYSCLRQGHRVRTCRNKAKCRVCGANHNALLCNRSPKREAEDKEDSASRSISGEVEVSTRRDKSLANLTSYPEVILQTLVVTLRGKDGDSKARAILDTASQRSYVLKRTVAEVGYVPDRKQKVQHSLFGGKILPPCDHEVYTLYLASLDGEYKCHFSVLDQPTICDKVIPIPTGPWISELKEHDINLSDFSEGPIEVLLGADAAGKLLTGRTLKLRSGLVAVETYLGWTLMGKVPGTGGKKTIVAVSMNLRRVSDRWSLDVLGIRDPGEERCKEILKQDEKEKKPKRGSYKKGSKRKVSSDESEEASDDKGSDEEYSPIKGKRQARKIVRRREAPILARTNTETSVVRKEQHQKGLVQRGMEDVNTRLVHTPELAAVVDQDSMARHEVKRFRTFGMVKYLKKHFC